MDLELKDKVVLVTGGAKGIGAAISRALAAEAAIPVIVDRDVEAANALHSQLPCSELVIAELSSPESYYAAIDHAVRKFSGLDALVNNATTLPIYESFRLHPESAQWVSDPERFIALRRDFQS